MKTIHFSIDLRSFFLGCIAVIGILLLANFKPTTDNQPDPTHIDNRRFQTTMGEKGTIILDTRTGDFVLLETALGQPRRFKYRFDEIELTKQK